jgi:D-3-phosphoglycerate dehydrogenase
MVLTYTVDGVKEKVARVLRTDFVNKDRADIRRTWRNVEENGPAAEPAPEGLLSLLAEADLLAIHICPISAETLMAAPKLKAIATARGGLENIDMKKATELGIAVINTPNHNSQAVAEYTIGLMLAETRNIARSYHALKTSVGWREYYPNTEFIPELNGSTIGLVGYGQTGRLVAKRLQSFDVRILVFDPFVDASAVAKEGCTKVELDQLLKESDIVSLHARLTDKTRGMIGEKQLRQMKPSSYLINTARAGLVDLDAFCRALKENWITGAAVDVYEAEPVKPDHPLFALDNVTVTNHRAGDTRNSYWVAPILMGKQFDMLLRGERPNFLANPDVLKRKNRLTE